MAFVALTTAETDAKSPMDDALWLKVKENFDDLDSRVINAAAAPFQFIVGGRLQFISGFKRSVAQMVTSEEFTPSRCRYGLKRSGSGGSMAFDIRKHTSPGSLITEIASQYSGATQSIARAGSALSTQSITRAATQIATQSITHAKAANNVQSIILLGTVHYPGADAGTDLPTLVQYNLASTIDSDTLVGDSIVFASCTTGANNGTFTIVEKNRGGGNNVVVTNASGVAQTGVAGNAQVKIMSYNFTNPVDTSFGAGYAHLFATHSTGANNGTLTIYAINQGGNNIWVKNSTGAVQAGVAGTVDTNFFAYNFSAPASATDYVVGESVNAASHTSGSSNGTGLIIIAVNSGGNNVVIHVSGGVTQGGVAGNIVTNRWIYSMPTDPSAQVSAGHHFFADNHTTAANNGYWEVKEVNRSAANNVVIYNTSGVAQAGVLGTIYSTRKLIKFASDLSATYNTNSYVELEGCVEYPHNSQWYYEPYRVLEVNRGGGANYNIVVDFYARGIITYQGDNSSLYESGVEQASPAGYVKTEMKSIFNTSPTLAYAASGLIENENLVGTSTDLIATAIPAQTPLMLYLTAVQDGDPSDFMVSIR